MLIQVYKFPFHGLNQKKIFLLDQEEFPFPWNINQWESSLEDKDTVIVVCIMENSIVGFILFSCFEIDKRLELLKIVTAKKFQGMGIAQQMYSFAISQFDNFDRCLLEVSTKNEQAIRFYNACGYEILHEKKQFYSNGDNAYSMQHKLK